ncbi:MAG TPA: V-type ATP synthase subunit I [Treponema sp.]|nr:V-type ATP synthase subunit I [Treponema sp.]
MIRPRKMKRVEMTILKGDIDGVIEYLGRREAIHFSSSEAGAGVSGAAAEGEAAAKIRALLDRLKTAAGYLRIELPEEPQTDSVMPDAASEAAAEKLIGVVEALRKRETEAVEEKKHIEETLNEAKSFSNLNASFSDLDQLSYLTLRLGRLDPENQIKLRESLGDRAVIIAMGDNGRRILAASSRKGRFALDSELKKYSFEAITVPKDYKGVPPEMLAGLEQKYAEAEKNLGEIVQEKERTRLNMDSDFKTRAASLLVGLAVQQIKARLDSTASIYFLSGWIPGDMVAGVASDLKRLSAGRVAIRAYDPAEISEVRDGVEKVPVSLSHSAFVKGFEGLVFSYGAPLYGTIDPTPMVAFFFTILFGVMFGDFGQGFVLLLAGILTGRHGLKILSKFKKYSSPLIAVGAASMVMGLLTGEVFTMGLLVRPTRAISAALTGHPVDHILTIMPLAEKGGSVRKLFYFFGFTIGIGVILNSVGLIINIINRCIMKKYEAAFFSKTGLAGLLLFWYALFIALRCIAGGRFHAYDFAGIFIPVFFIFFGSLIWRIISRQKPLLEHGFLTFFMEGFVEMIETASSYISNTVSFLRVGAFALSHAVLSYIVFRFSDLLASSSPVGSVSALVIMIFGNLVIIVLEGMIVAIQVVRLQYYEFFSKFFTETGVEFSPFRFGKKTDSVG